MVCREKTNSESDGKMRDGWDEDGTLARLSSGSHAENKQSGKRQTRATIACLPETRQEGIYGQVCYDQVFKTSQRERQTCAATKAVFKVKNFTEWY